MIKFVRTEHKNPYPLEDIVGMLPYCWDVGDPRSAVIQHNEKQIGNGPFSNMKGFKLDPETLFLSYPGDPTLKPLAIASLPLTKERIVVYQYAWVAIVQEDGNFVVDRRD